MTRGPGFAIAFELAPGIVRGPGLAIAFELAPGTGDFVLTSALDFMMGFTLLRAPGGGGVAGGGSGGSGPLSGTPLLKT